MVDPITSQPGVIGVVGVAVGALASVATIAVKGLVGKKNGVPPPEVKCARHDGLEKKMDALTEKSHGADIKLAEIGKDVKFLIRARQEDREKPPE